MLSTIPMEETYALSIDFDEDACRHFLNLIPAGARKQLQTIFSNPFSEPQMVEVLPGALVAAVCAELGEPQRNDDKSYVPFIALEFRSPASISSLTVED